MNSKAHEQIQVAIYQTGMFSETYYFVLDADGGLTIEKGTRVGDDITQNPFIIKDSSYDYKTERKQLSGLEISTMIDLANKVYDGGFEIS